MDEHVRSNVDVRYLDETAFAKGLSELAPVMRRIAHIPSNIVRPPRDLFGWVERVRRTDGTVEDIRCTFPGYVPHELRRAEDGQASTVQLAGETVSFVEDLAPYLGRRIRLEWADHTLRIAYTLDQSPKGETVRHLSLQVTAQMRLSADEVNGVKDQLLEQQAPIVRLFMPAAALGQEVGARITVGTPWEYRNPALPRDVRAVGWRTPLVYDFVMTHDLTRPAHNGTPVRLYGPDGQPL